MSKSGGSLDRGRRLRHEVPEVPADADLTEQEREAQRQLRRLVDEGGGRFAALAIPIGHVAELATYLDGWARRQSDDQNGRVYFSGRPGLWHALDELYPLQDPNRWDGLRKRVIADLEDRGWQRVSPPRGSSFYLPERLVDR